MNFAINSIYYVINYWFDKKTTYCVKQIRTINPVKGRLVYGIFLHPFYEINRNISPNLEI